MNHPIISSALGKAKHDEMLQTAENYRRAKNLQQEGRAHRVTFSSIVGFWTALFGGSQRHKTAEPATRAS